MDKTSKPKEKSVIDAKYDAQKLAFAPVSFQVTKSLRDLGILEFINKNRRKGVTAEEVAEALDISMYGIDLLLELGETIELVSLNEDKYTLTKTGFIVLTDKMTTANIDFVQDVCYKGLFELTETIKQGKPVGLNVFGDYKTIYEGLSKLPAHVQKSWFTFDHYYSDTAFPDALPIIFKRQPKRLFDIGGNTGKWAIQCSSFNPDVEVTILDLPGQLNKAKLNIKEKGLTDRVKFHEIDLLSASPVFPDYAPDAIWMSQFLDCFSKEEIIKILQTAKSSMTENTDLYILETYWDRQRFEASKFTLQATSVYFAALANGNSKMYKAQELYDCISAAGLKVVEDIDDIGISHTLLRCTL